MIETVANEPEEKDQSVTKGEEVAEQPPESLFARTKRLLFGILKYLSCSSRRVRVRKEEPGTEQEGCTLTDCDTAVSISTECHENWQRLFEYCGEPNLIDCLPSELLAYVASYLPNTDFNSFVRINKATHGRLRNKDRPPTHVNYTLNYKYDDERKNLILISVLLDRKTANAVIIRHQFFLLASRESLLQNDPIYQSEEWTKRAISDQYILNRRCRCDLRYMLSARLKFFCGYNFIVDKITVVGAKEIEVTSLAVTVKENMRLQARQLELSTDVLGEQHMDLIHACRPSSLLINDSFVPSTFHDDPVVRQLNELEIRSGLVEMEEGSLDAYRSTHSLFMEHIQGVTARDIRLVIDQWSRSTKTDGLIRLFMAIEDAASVAKNLLERVDRELVEVQEITEQVFEEGNTTTFLFRRLADDCQLEFGWLALGDIDAAFVEFHPEFDSSSLRLD